MELVCLRARVHVQNLCNCMNTMQLKWLNKTIAPYLRRARLCVPSQSIACWIAVCLLGLFALYR